DAHLRRHPLALQSAVPHRRERFAHAGDRRTKGLHLSLGCAARPGARDVLKNAITNLDKPLSEANCASLRIGAWKCADSFWAQSQMRHAAGSTILHRRAKLHSPAWEF